MKSNLEAFVHELVIPMLSGGPIHVRTAMSTRDRAAMLADAGALGDAQLRFVRLRRGQDLVAHPHLPEPGAEELSFSVSVVFELR